LIFGTDQYPDGLWLWKRPKGIVQPDILPTDFVKILDFEGSQDELRALASSGWANFYGGAPSYIMPFGYSGSAVGGFSKIVASVDGLNWHEIWRHHTKKDYKLQYTVGPHPDDPTRTFYTVC